MKFVKNHLMFILPLMAILLGVEFYLVFDRTTDSYEKTLKEGYTMLVVTKKPVTLQKLKVLNKHIANIKAIEREQIISEVIQGVSKENKKEILAALPYFYNVGLDSYLGTLQIKQIQYGLEKDPNIKRVETFGSSYSSAYRLFSFIKFLLKVFIGFMGMVSLFLIVKQIEVWKYTHRERMEIMEIFGAPPILRSGILFKVAISDAFIATFFVSGIFFYVKFIWATQSGINLIVHKKNELFQVADMIILLGIALLLVVMAVYSVVTSSRGAQE
ncbi:MAG: cell division protein FtsX [Sulfurovum sp.]|nr:cell division protein FtsX [Sulfurovum sp.]